MKAEKVMNRETVELFKDKYCDVSISTPIMEEQDIRFCAVGYDEQESLFIIDKDGVHIELDGNEIDNVEVDDEKRYVPSDKPITITLAFTDGTVIVIRPVDNFEARQRYAHELLMLELTRDRYKREMFEECIEEE